MKAIDLFCGAGGMSLGFAQAGFQVLAGVDNWDHAIECYAQNFPKHETVTMDLQDWKAIVAKFTGVDFDVLIGGPPCQDFSEAGDQVEGDKAELTKSYARVVAKLRPKYFVMENVPRALQSKAYKTARGIFKRAGYGLTEIVLDASLCGVPQRRKRFFCIGSLANRNGFLKKTLQVLQRDVPMTLRDYVGSEFDFAYYYRHPRTYGRRGVFSLDEPAPTMRGCNRPLPRAYKVHEDDVVNPHALNVRALTFSERARVQMFPSDYKWTEHATSNEQMIGNAVPVGLAKFVGSCLSRFVQKGDKGLPMTFVEWLQKKFLTNGKTEMALYDPKKKCVPLERNNYLKIVTVLNRLIEHINNGRRCRNEAEVKPFLMTQIPSKHQLVRMGKKEEDFMEPQIKEFWKVYVAPELKAYVRQMNRKKGKRR